MIFLTFFIIFSVFSLHMNCDCNDIADNSNEEKLIFAHIVYRHGDRTIIEPYPNDPYKNKSYWPEGFGQLTNLGKEHQYELGQYFRRRYQKLLGDAVYSSDLVHIQSTDVDRTLMSAQANLAGLFPPRKQNLWNKVLHWQPIPVHTIPKNHDYILAGRKKCDKYEKAVEKFQLTADYLNLIRNYKDLYEYLEKHTGKKMKKPKDVSHIYSTLRIESGRSLDLPDWTKKVFPHDTRMQYIAERSFALSTHTPLMARLKIGFLLREIFERSQKKTDCHESITQKLWFYSAHDSTLVNILNALKLYNFKLPPFRSSILFELYKLRNEYSIKIFYKNSSTENLIPLNIPHCGPSCPLEKIIQIYKDILPEGDFHTECRVHGFALVNLSLTEIGIIALIAIVLSVIVVIPTIYCNYIKRDPWPYSPL